MICLPPYKEGSCGNAEGFATFHSEHRKVRICQWSSSSL
jgi:hypothetical protein